MMNIKQALAMGLLLSSVGQIASAQDDAVEGKDSNERICLNVRAIRTFDAITDKYLYVKEGSSKHYLFTMRNACHNLRDAMGIAIKDTTSRVCSDGSGEVVYRDRMGGRRLESCRIESIERVESKDDAKAIARSHQGCHSSNRSKHAKSAGAAGLSARRLSTSGIGHRVAWRSGQQIRLSHEQRRVL